MNQSAALARRQGEGRAPLARGERHQRRHAVTFRRLGPARICSATPSRLTPSVSSASGTVDAEGRLESAFSSTAASESSPSSVSGRAGSALATPRRRGASAPGDRRPAPPCAPRDRVRRELLRRGAPAPPPAPPPSPAGWPRPPPGSPPGRPRGRRGAGSCRWRSSAPCRPAPARPRGPATSCSSATARRTAPAISSTPAPPRRSARSTSWTTTSRSSPSTSTAKAAPQPGAQGRMGALGGQLEVLRIVVAAAEDDQVLEPAGDEQLAVEDEPEVAGAQEAALAAVAGEPGAGSRAPSPPAAASSPAATLGPATQISPTRPGGSADRGLGIDDRDPLRPSQAPPQPTRPRTAAPLAGRHRLVPLQRAAASTARTRKPPARRAAGDEEGRLGQAVAGVEGLAAEAAGGEGRGEALERLGAHRLGAVEGDLPAREVEPLRAPPAAISADAEVVGEVGAAAGRRAGSG